jgi:small subunit ribosomal protein S17
MAEQAKIAPALLGANIPGRRPRRTMTGTVVSNKMQKTVVVKVERQTRNRLYGRTVRVSKSFKAHDELNRCVVGDTVVIAESRPISKDKHWVVQSIVRRGTGEPIPLQEIPDND